MVIIIMIIPYFVVLRIYKFRSLNNDHNNSDNNLNDLQIMSDNNCFAAKRGVTQSSPKLGGITAKHSRTLSANGANVRKP